MADDTLDTGAILRALATQGIPGVIPPTGGDPFRYGPGSYGQAPQETGGAPAGSEVEDFQPGQPGDEVEDFQPGVSPSAPAPTQAPAPKQDILDSAVSTDEKDQETAALAETRAKEAEAERKAQAVEAGQKPIEQENEAYFKTVEANNRQTDSEVARWMAEVDAKSKEEASPQRWWDNTSGFGKSLYLLGLAFGAAAQARDPTGRTQNVVLDMINHEIDQDVASQRDRQAKELAALKEKGGVMTARQARDAKFLGDVHAAKVAHLNALSQALDLRASAPGDEDEKAAILQAKAHVDGLKVEVAKDKWDTISRQKESAANRAAEWDRQTREINKDMALAQISTSARVSAAEAKAAGERLTLPRSSGAALVNPATGDVQRIELPKGEEGTKAAEYIRTSGDEYNKLKRLSDKLGNTSQRSMIFKSDASLQSAIYDALIPLEMKEGGTRAVDMKAAGDRIAAQLFGTNPNGWFNVVKGLGPDEIKKVIDDRIGRLNKETEAHVSGVLGSNLSDLEDKGYRVSFVAPPTQDSPEHQVTGEEVSTDVTGTPHSSPRPTTAARLKEYQDAGLPVPELPDELSKALDRVETGVRLSSEANANTAIQNARQAIDRWEAIHTDTTPGWGKPATPEGKAEVDSARKTAAQARATLDVLSESLSNRDSERDLSSRLETVVSLKRQGQATLKDAKDVETVSGLNLDSTRLQELVDQVNERLAAKRRLFGADFGVGQ